MKRRCLNCGMIFNGQSGQTLCPDCAIASKASIIIRRRFCRQCEASFEGGPRAWYCPECRIRRRREADARFRAKGRKADRPLGSTDKCIVCGKDYIVNSARQKYCPACAPEAIRAVDRLKAREWNAQNIDYAARSAARRAAAAAISCKICGKQFVPHDASLTCSSECSAELARRNKAEYERCRREERNAYRRQLRKKKLASMTPEELNMYREKINANARKNYAKRKAPPPS